MPDLPLDDPVVAELLSNANLARLAYVGLDGRPRVVPIWFQYRDGAVVMITGPKAEKARALAANGAVSLTIDSSQPPYKVLLVQGDAALEERVASDVEEGVAHPGGDERDGRHRRHRQRGDDGDRKAPAGEGRGEDGRQAGLAGKAGGRQGPDEAAGAHRRGQPADARLTEPEELDRGDDRQRQEEATDEYLGEEVGDDERRPGPAGESLQARRDRED